MGLRFYLEVIDLRFYDVSDIYYHQSISSQLFQY